MAKHAHSGETTHRFAQGAASLVAWHDARPRASLSSLRGWVWMALIAAVFFWMSNPLVFVPGFHLALPKAITWTTIVVIVTLPWVRLPRVPWPWVVFFALVALSSLWTIDPHLTEYSTILYLKITVIALVIAANCEPPVVCWGLGVGGVVTTALSLYAYREELWGAWDLIEAENGGLEKVLLGVGTNDNILAYTLTVAFAAALAAGLPRSLVPRVAWLLVLGTNVYGLYRAGSATGFLTVLSILLVWAIVLAWPALRQRGQRQAVAWAGGMIATLAIGTALVATALGKELSTVSGRAPFWRATIEATLDRSPLVGSGWGAVWQHPWSMVPPNEVVQDIATRAGYSLSHGHNFFIDVLPELGVVGLGVALVMVAYTAREVRRNGLHEGGPDPVLGRLTLLVLVALLVSGITEPMLTAPLGWWSLALVTALSRQRWRVTPRLGRLHTEELRVAPPVPQPAQNPG